jgi:hypothetical protein
MVMLEVAGEYSRLVKADDEVLVAVHRRRRGHSALSKLGTSFTRGPGS